ncbi:hypothetical protein [Ornithinimicrobium kibberense]|uniref:hypothetical protein n=1 Tax=Ornithinimicrobium kibberense TaxID=282060 RepID=UPI00362337BD
MCGVHQVVQNCRQAVCPRAQLSGIQSNGSLREHPPGVVTQGPGNDTTGQGNALTDQLVQDRTTVVPPPFEPQPQCLGPIGEDLHELSFETGGLDECRLRPPSREYDKNVEIRAVRSGRRRCAAPEERGVR